MLFDLDYKKVTLNEEAGITLEIKAVDAKNYSLLVKQMRSILKLQSEVDLTTQLGQVEVGLSQLEDPELVELCKNIFPVYCQNLTGIEIKENGSTRPALIEDLYRTSQGLTLCIQIISELFTLSTSTAEEQEEVKKQ